MNNNIKKLDNADFEVEKKTKKIKLWKWPKDIDDHCIGCIGEEEPLLCGELAIDCNDCIWKTEKPEPEFIEVEVDE